MSELPDAPARPHAAVLLAAGEGRRLRPNTDRPKPLVRVLGLSLAERTICTFAEDLGVARIVAVLGHRASEVRAHLSEVARRRGVAIEFVSAEDWRLGNGASARAAEAEVGDEPFYLAMIDHLFDPEIARRLAAAPPGPGEVALAVDADKEGVFDLDDVTRVRCRDRRIEAIAKRLEPWDGADTGLFLCTFGLFDALSQAAAQGRHGLTDGIALLAARGRARAVEVTGLRWLDVDTPAALREAARRLFDAERGKPNDGPVSRYLNRPLSRRLSALLARTPITPNQISLAAFALSAAAAALIAAGGHGLLAAGGVAAQIASVIDGCDGEVARLKRRKSAFGGWLDAVLDRYADGFLIFALMWHGYAASPGAAWLFAGTAALLGSFLNSYTADKYDRLMAERIAARGLFRLGRDVRVFVVFLAALADQPLAGLILLAVAMNAEVVRRIVLCARAESA